MKFMKQVGSPAILVLIFLINTPLAAQNNRLILDKETRLPISFVNIYTKNGEKVLGAMSDESGRFNLNFPFHSLTFSHINYSTREIDKKNLSDTVYLSPVGILLNEVVVNNKKPQWVNRILQEVILQKQKHYQNTEQQVSYHYTTGTLTDSSGYAFRSSGDFVIPVLSKNEAYSINPADNTIRYKDKTAGPDFSNLKRMIYNDFIRNFDAGFITKYSFIENNTFENKDRHLVQLVFRSKKYVDDNGYIVVDTLNKVILEFERKSGTDFNIKTQTSLILRTAISTIQGFRYNEWVTQIHGKFALFGNSYQLSECQYKFHMKSTVKNKKINRTYFSSIESQLTLDNGREVQKANWITLPKPYYMIPILTKKMQKEESLLNSVPVKFEHF